MNIPVILEVAIGLIFIYLILSLLASEIQEIIGTLLQWRAEHLKRSIELLLAGEIDDNLAAAEAFADRLYSNPLIRGLNQEARGRIARAFRRITQAIGSVYRWITRTRNTFGAQHSAPSYIPAETFATTLLGTLDIEGLGRQLTDCRFQQFVYERLLNPVQRIVHDLRASMGDEALLDAELEHFETSLTQLLQDFAQRRITLITSLNQLLDQLSDFAELAKTQLPQQDHRVETFLYRLNFLKRAVARSDAELTALMKRLEPSLSELLAILDRSSDIYRECVEIVRQGRGTPQNLHELRSLLQTLNAESFPPKLQESLQRLAERAERKAEALEDRLRQFETEIMVWFNRSMERASGVYRRNARGIAFLLGIAIAAGINADTFYIVSRLAKDPAIRTSITQSVDQFVPQSGETVEQDLTTIRDAVNDLITELPLPLGRSETVLALQAEDAREWPFPIPRQYFGWLITGIAISMGSSFWFDLLSKVVKVRSTGNTPPPPASTPGSQPPNS